MPLIPPLHLQRSYKRVTGGYLFRRFWLLTVAVLWFAPPALANPLADYCVERLAHQPKPSFAARAVGEEPAPVTFKVKGKPFQVKVSRDRLLLTQGTNPTPLTEVPVPQREFRVIHDLASGKDGWLWINGHEIDYMVPLDLQLLPPTFGQPVALPHLMRDLCSSKCGIFWVPAGAPGAVIVPPSIVLL